MYQRRDKAVNRDARPCAGFTLCLAEFPELPQAGVREGRSLAAKDPMVLRAAWIRKCSLDSML